MSEAESGAAGQVSSMATQQNQIVSGDAIAERRGWERVTPELLTYVTLSEDNGQSASPDNGGMVLDVSQGGLAIATALAISDGLRLIISIPADPTHPPIEVFGRVVWRAQSKRRFGVRLEEISAKDRELLRRWILAIAGPGSKATKGLAPAIAPATEIAIGSGVPALPLDAAAGGLTASVARAATPGEVRPSPAQRPQLRPELVRKLPGAAEKSADVSLRPSSAPRSSPSPVPTGIAASAPAPVAPSVAQGRGLGENRSLVVGAALVSVVVVSFVLGIVLGKNVLTQRAIRRATANGESQATRNQNQKVPQTVAAAAGPAKSKAVANPGAGGSASYVAPSQSPSGNVAAAAAGNLLKPSVDTRASTVASGSSREPALATREASGTAAVPAGREVLVTPNEGESPLRIEFAEEVSAQSSSMEIRSRRFALVPGVPSSSHGKVKKQRLVLGSMISRVTPQASSSAIAAGGPDSGEQVVSVRATIAGDGHVAYVDPLSGPITLIPGVMSAVREWRYEPSTLDGEPFETGVDLTITFRRAR